MLQSKIPIKAKRSRTKRGAKKAMQAESDRAHATRGGTKQQAVLGLLRQPSGATIPVMMKATGWQPHSVRGFLAGVVRRKLKLKLESKMVDGARVYRVVGEAPPKAGGQQSKRQAA
jgi:Protein of unknown function (DUF3489)